MILPEYAPLYTNLVIVPKTGFPARGGAGLRRNLFLPYSGRGGWASGLHKSGQPFAGWAAPFAPCPRVTLANYGLVLTRQPAFVISWLCCNPLSRDSSLPETCIRAFHHFHKFDFTHPRFCGFDGLCIDGSAQIRSS